MVVGLLGPLYAAVKGVLPAFGAFHLYHGMLDADVGQFVFYLLSDAVGCADLLVMDLYVAGKGGYSVPYGPYVDVMYAYYAGYF